MKKNLLLILLFLAGSAMLAQAQVEKGHWLLSGNTSLDLAFGKDKYKSGSTSEDGDTYSNIGFYPKAGYFVIDNLAVGLMLDLGLGTEKSPKDSYYKHKYSYTSLLIGPFARYYITEINDFWPYAEAGIRFGSLVSKSTDSYRDSSTDKSTSSEFGYHAGVGVTNFVTEHVGLDAFIGFGGKSHSWEGEDGGDYRSADKHKYISNQLMINFGFTIILGN